MAYEYKRRRPSIIRNFWVYRRLIGTAILLGLMLWFIWANDAQVTVAFPFGLGKLTSTTGVVILMSALVGSLATILVTTLIFAIRRIRTTHRPARPAQPHRHGRRPPPCRLRRQNHRGVSQRSLVKLTRIREWGSSPYQRFVTWRDTVLRSQPVGHQPDSTPSRAGLIDRAVKVAGIVCA